MARLTHFLLSLPYLFLAAGCADKPKPASAPIEEFKVLASVIDHNKSGVADAKVFVDAKRIGITGPSGKLRAVWAGKVGDSLRLSVKVPDGYKARGALEQSFVLSKANDKPVDILFQAELVPKRRQYLVWVNTSCTPGQGVGPMGCVGRPVLINGKPKAVTAWNGVAHFILEGEPGEKLQVAWQPPAEGDKSEPSKQSATTTLQEDKPILLVSFHARRLDASAARITKTTDTAAAAPVDVGRPTRRRDEGLIATDTKQSERTRYRGSIRTRRRRSVQVRCRPSGAYLYIDNKRHGKVGEHGLIIEKMPVGNYRFALKMPASAKRYYPPVKKVVEVKRGRGVQLFKFAFSDKMNEIVALRKKVAEGGRLTSSDRRTLQAVRPANPEYGEAQGVLISYYEKTGRPRKALKALEKLSKTSRYSVDPEVYYHIAMLRTKLGRYSRARRSLQQMERYINQYKARERKAKMARMYKLRAQIHSLLFAAGKGRKPGLLEASNRDWRSYIGMTASEAEKKKAEAEIEKNNKRLKRLLK